jgi:hypothetical protein
MATTGFTATVFRALSRHVLHPFRMITLSFMKTVADFLTFLGPEYLLLALPSLRGTAVERRGELAENSW